MATDAYAELVIGFMLDAAATLPIFLGSEQPQGRWTSPTVIIKTSQVTRWMHDGGLVLKGL